MDELDEDLLIELNQVAHENQLAYLPFARSGRAEAVLFDRYPELVEKIERGKRAKIDAIVLSNKYADGDISSSFRAQSLEEVSASPLRQRTKRRASKEVKTPTSPALKGKRSAQDLMFEMSDGEDDEENSLEKIKPPRFTEQSVNEAKVETPIGSPEAPWSTTRSQNRKSPGGLDQGFETSLPSASPLPPPLVQPIRPAGQPWGAAPLSGVKLDLKDIMEQTSTSTPSNLTLGLSRRESEQKAAASHSKMSQKERKRLQQAQQLGTPIEKPQPAPPTVSPWQAATHRKPSNTPMMAPAQQPSPKGSPQPSRASSTPQLTMRQTVANNGAAKQKAKQPVATVASNAASPKRPAANERGMSVSTDPIPTPRSVRHIPLPQHDPTSPSQNLSMMEILSLQEAEKTSIRDAAAKRSLQEIQQEQEFQAWWDEESKRVVQEEEQRKRAEERAVRNATRGRGKARGGRAGKGKGQDRTDEKDNDRGKGSRDVVQDQASAGPASAKPAPKHEGAERGRGRGRGHRGGRGGPRGGRIPGRQRNDASTAGMQTASPAQQI